MKINISKTLYFSTEDRFIAPFRASEEGVHLCETLDAMKRVVVKLREKNFVYSIEPNTQLHPLYVDEDILLWSGENLAELFLCKLDNKKYPACFVGQKDIDPSKVHINITEADRAVLNNIKETEDEIESFHMIMDFIKSKGYNCINYLVFEGNRTTDRTVVCDDRFDFNYDSLKLLYRRN